MLREQVAQYTADLDSTTAQLYATRSEQGRKLMEVQHALSEAQQERQACQAKLTAAETRDAEHKARAEKSARELEELRSQLREEEQSFREESLTKERLLELYKAEATAAKAKANEAREGVTSLRKLLKESQKETAAVRNDRSQELERVTQVSGKWGGGGWVAHRREERTGVT